MMRWFITDSTMERNVDDPYIPVKLDEFIKENRSLLDGDAFLIITAKPLEDQALSMSVLASPMSLEVMRGLILAAAYHHNMQEDSVDLLLTKRAEVEELIND